MEISRTLKKWYSQNKRDLPWRENKNPYRIWVSEVILQQTRIDQGTDYYLRFIQKFPDIFSLATATIDEVLKYWQGLGYYSRARNLHIAANQLVDEHNGEFPSEYHQILKLKGIGKYTAGAIASIAFNLPFPAVDGNVRRIYTRLYGIEGNTNTYSELTTIEDLVLETIDKEHPGDFNQSLMDFGSLVCKPRNPQCHICPLSEKCSAYSQNRVSEFPAIYKKPKLRTRYFYYLVFTYNEKFFIEQRIEEDIWKLLYQFPLIEENKKLDMSQLITEIEKKFQKENTKFEIESVSNEMKHILSHQRIFARFIEIKISDPGFLTAKTGIKMIPYQEIINYAIPRLIDRFVNIFISLHS